MTAFRTRYGLFEWLVIPFGLANAFNTFQRYINWALRIFLNEFCSAYVDDILIYIDGSRTEHQKQFFLKRLRETGLQLDVNKCEFEMKTTKDLGFIIEVKKSIIMSLKNMINIAVKIDDRQYDRFIDKKTWFKPIPKNKPQFKRDLMELDVTEKLIKKKLVTFAGNWVI